MQFSRAFARCLILSCSLLIFSSIPQPAPAAEPELTLEQRVALLESAVPVDEGSSAVDTGDNAWMLISCGMVLMMTAPGLILFYGGMGQFLNQVKGVLFTMVLAGGGTFVILKIVNATIGLRVDREEETLGLDLSQHGERAHND